jgi:hypothetical protein
LRRGSCIGTSGPNEEAERHMDIPCIKLSPREYTDLRIKGLRKERENAMEVLDERWVALGIGIALKLI